MTQGPKELAEALTKHHLVFQHSDASLEEALSGVKTFYLGIDPTADSLHVGHLVPLSLARTLMKSGMKAIILLGGATGMIGDPSGKTSERTALSEGEVSPNARALKGQIAETLGTSKFELVNNESWLKRENLLEFLRDIGKHFTINEMIRKENVRERIERPEVSISYTEFSYALLQAYDFFHLFERHEATLQVGGSDQWGNITSGIELIRKKLGKSAHGITFPLLVDKITGKKFGKSESGAVWLDGKKTKPFTFYQFWLSLSDESALEFLPMLTEISDEEISRIEREMKEHPEERSAQRALAQEETSLIHGGKTATACERTTEILFGGKISFKELSREDKRLLLGTALTIELSRKAFSEGILFVDFLTEKGIMFSKREAREFIQNGAITLNDEKITDLGFRLVLKNLPEELSLIRKGKKEVFILSY